MTDEVYNIVKKEYFKTIRMEYVARGLLDKSDPENLVFRVKHPIGVKKYLENTAGMNPYFTRKIDKEDYEEVLEYASKEHSEEELDKLIVKSSILRKKLEAKDSPAMRGYEKLPECEKYLVQTMFMDTYEFVDRWIEGKKDIVGQYILRTGIFTENGEEVFTKEDKEFADMLRNLGVVYFYMPIPKGKDYGNFLPRFILVNLRTREDFYYDHFENVTCKEQMKYVEKTCKKHDKNEIVAGKNYFYTTQMEKDILGDPKKNPIIPYIF